MVTLASDGVVFVAATSERPDESNDLRVSAAARIGSFRRGPALIFTTASIRARRRPRLCRPPGGGRLRRSIAVFVCADPRLPSSGLLGAIQARRGDCLYGAVPATTNLAQLGPPVLEGTHIAFRIVEWDLRHGPPRSKSSVACASVRAGAKQ